MGQLQQLCYRDYCNSLGFIWDQHIQLHFKNVVARFELLTTECLAVTLLSLLFLFTL